MGKGSGGGTNTVTNNSQPPQAVLDQYTNLIGQANTASANPLNQYGGSMVAGFTPDQLSAFNTVDNSQGIAQPYINQAQTMLQNSTQPLWNSAQQWSPNAIQQYMNPYQQDVTNATMANINETNAQQQQQVVGNAISSGAWGGDRSAIAQSELARQQALASNQTLAGLNANNYGQATAQFNQQQGAQLGANATTASLNSQGAFGMANLGTQAQSNALQGAAAQLATGQQQQTLAQSALNIPYEQFQQQQAYPYQDLSWLSGISTGLGSGMGGTSSTTSPSASNGSQLFGDAVGAVGALGSTGAFGSAGWLTSALAFSDRRLKDHIQRIGRFKDYPLYKFNYKGDDRQNIGVMAQDVEKKNPGAVHEIDGYKAVDYSKLARGGPARGFTPPRYDDGGAIPNVDLSFIPNISMTRGMGIPKAPAAYHAPQSSGPSQAVGLMAQLGKMGSGGGENPLGLSSGSGFTASDLNKIGADFDQYGGGFGPATFSTAGMARGGMADGGIPDDVTNAQNVVDLFDPPMDDGSPAPAGGMGPPPPPPAFTPTAGIAPPDKYGTPPKFDGAGSDPINKVDPWLALASAGFGMAAGNSPHALQNIATGAQAGIKNLQEQKEEAAKESNEQGTLRQRGEQLFDQANEWRNKLFEESSHNTIEEGLKSKEIANNAHNQLLERQKPIPDGFGGFLIPNPSDPTHPTTIYPGAGTNADGSQVSMQNVWKQPVGADGKPLVGDDYYKTLPAPVATEARLIQNGDKAPPTAFASKNPTLLAAEAAAKNADPTYVGTRYSTIQDFTKGNGPAATIQAQTAVMEHIPVLQKAMAALDNGDMRVFNTIAQELAKQTGSPIPTNFESGRNIVFDEVAKAVLGPRSTLADRQEFVKNASTSASGKQLSGQLDEAGKYISGQQHALENRWVAGTGFDNNAGNNSFRERFINPKENPNGRALYEKYYPTPLPAPGQRVAGKTYYGPGGKPGVWTGAGWTDPQGAQ